MSMTYEEAARTVEVLVTRRWVDDRPATNASPDLIRMQSTWIPVAEEAMDDWRAYQVSIGNAHWEYELTSLTPDTDPQERDRQLAEAAYVLRAEARWRELQLEDARGHNKGLTKAMRRLLGGRGNVTALKELGVI